MTEHPPITAWEDGVSLAVHIQPRSSRNRVVGCHGGAIKIQLAAPPVEGAANEALLKFVAEILGVPRRAVQLLSGGKSRRKRLVVHGCAPAMAAARLGLAP